MRSVPDANRFLGICRNCDQWKTCPVRHKLRDETLECPLAKWDNMLPLGEIIHAMAAPIARAASTMGVTVFDDCGGCGGRRVGANKVGQAVTRFVRGK